MLWISCALAGFWHPGDVASSSAVYASAAERSQAPALAAQQRARALAAALVDYEEALDLLGPAAPAAERERHAALERAYNRSFAVLQAHADAQVEGFDRAFGEAVGRALRAHPGAVRCQRERVTFSRVPGIPSRSEPNPDCTGDDLNARLAAALDADPTLAQELSGLLAQPWPTLDLDLAPVPPIGGSGGVSVTAFWRALAPRELDRLRLADEDARFELFAAIEQGEPTEARRARVERAREIDRQTAAKRAELAAPVHARASALLAKRAPDVGWCAQPAALGGCAGDDPTDALVPVLLADKKLRKAVP